MPAAFENLISITDSSSPFYDVCAKHFMHSVFHRFPNNVVDGLKLILAGAMFYFFFRYFFKFFFSCYLVELFF